MAKREEGVLEMDRPAEPQAAAPVLVVPLGRGGRGKSEIARWVWERARDAGRTMVAADADRTNPTLSAFVPAVMTPESSAAEDVKAFISQMLEAQITTRHSAVLDLGGGDLVLKDFVREVPLVEFLGEHGIEPVAVHMIGPDKDDLAYLRDLEEGGLFAPRRTILVLNEGVIPTGRATASAFRDVVDHPVFRAAVARGAQPIIMPRLACMAQLDSLRVGFGEAEAGAKKDGVARIGPVPQFMVRKWRRDMEEAFARVAEWLA